MEYLHSFPLPPPPCLPFPVPPALQPGPMVKVDGGIPRPPRSRPTAGHRPPRLTARNLPPRISGFASQKPTVMCRWVPPPAGEIAINCDASVRTDRIGLGCIGRSHTGAVVFAVAAARRNRDRNSVVYHELEAILRGLQEALCRGFSAVRVFSDSLISVEILNCVREAERSCDDLILQIAAAASMLLSVSFSFTYREANSPADFLSKHCHLHEEEWVSDDSMGDFPEEFQYLLCLDAFGMFHLRMPK